MQQYKYFDLSVHTDRQTNKQTLWLYIGVPQSHSQKNYIKFRFIKIILNRKKNKK